MFCLQTPNHPLCCVPMQWPLHNEGRGKDEAGKDTSGQIWLTQVLLTIRTSRSFSTSLENANLMNWEYFT